MSPELQPMAVQYYCQLALSVSPVYCTAIEGSSGHVIRTYYLHKYVLV